MYSFGHVSLRETAGTPSADF